jgi:hypothetical protein
MRPSCLLAALLAACSGTPRPFGTETSTIKLVAGDVAQVGFRVNRMDDGGMPSLTVAPADVGIAAQFGPTVVEDDAVAGALEITSSGLMDSAEATVRVGTETIRVIVSSPLPVQLDARTMRRSTVAVSSAVITALADDGSVYATGADGGAARGLYSAATQAVALNGPQYAARISLDSEAADLRGDEYHLVQLNADGTVPSVMRSQVAAIRPTWFSAANPLGGTQFIFPDVYLATDGTVSLGDGVPLARHALDTTAEGFFYARSDGVLFRRGTVSANGYLPMFALPSVRAFEGDSVNQFDGNKPVRRRTVAWVTADGVLWGTQSQNLSDIGRTEAPVRAIPLPPNVKARDVAVRGDVLVLYGDDGNSYLSAGVLGQWRVLPFPKLRPPSSVDFSVTSDAIAFLVGQTLQVPLRIRRRGVDGAVTLTPRAPPADVTVDALDIPAGATEASVSVTLAADGQVRPFELMFDAVSDGVARTVGLRVDLPRVARRRTLAGDVALKKDGSVWRLSTPPAPIAGLSNIVSIGSALALNADGAVFRFDSLNVVTAMQGLPRIVAIAQSSGNGQALSLALDEAGAVWWWGTTSGSVPPTETPVKVTGVPRMVDVGADGHGSGLDETGRVWLLPSGHSFSGVYARLGLVFEGGAGIPTNASIDGTGLIGSAGTRVLWYTGYATLTSNLVCGLNGGAGYGVTECYRNTEGAVYATTAGLVLKANGTVWKRAGGGLDYVQMTGIGDVALPR